MKRTRILAAIVVLFTGSAVAEPAPSGQTPPLAAEEALRGAADQIMNGVRMMILAIPQYEVPEMLENGDILIRRKRPEPVDAVPDSDTQTDL
ncbi:MAG: hypothetical protein Q7N95_00715 [Alphaproteobacteria bacterium]|nr:hypothetical protein [Alphaproteobacteria bacterium]